MYKRNVKKNHDTKAPGSDKIKKIYKSKENHDTHEHFLASFKCIIIKCIHSLSHIVRFFLLPAPLFLTWSVVNSIHWWSGSTQALPATTVLLLLGAWVLVGFPLTVIGGIVGKNRAGSFQAPCRTRNIARQIPPQPWYKHTAVHMAIGGFLPFR